MKFLTLTKTTFFISCVLACLTLTACDDTEKKPQSQAEIATTPTQENQHNQINNTENVDAEVNIDELDSLLNEVSAETGQPLNATEMVEEPKIEPVADNNKPIISADNNILAQSLSKGLATGFNYQLANNKQWQQAEKDCFGKINNDFLVTELAKLVKTTLNQDEWQQATKFYYSSASKQLEQWRDNHIADVVKNQNITINDMNISESDLSAINEFMGSSANTKINQLIASSQIEQLIAQKIAPQMLACGMANN